MIKRIAFLASLFLLVSGVGFASIPKTTKVSENDTTAGYLNGKLVAGTGVTFTENSDGGNETLTIATSAAASINWDDVTSGELQSAGINWTDVDALEIQASGVNWTSLSGNIQTAGINWSSIADFANGYVLQGKTGGSVQFVSPSAASVNWDEIVNGELQAAGVNWVSLNGDIQKAGVNWSSWPSLYTDTKTIYFESPTANDDFKSIWTAPYASTITKISCESDQTVNFDLQVDDGSPAAVNGSNIACTTFATDSSLAGDTTMAAGNRLDLAVASVANTPTWVSISWEYRKD